MPRGPRLDAPGAVQHVIVRGVERRDIFRDDHDRRALLKRLSDVVPDAGCVCFAWVLMSNHIHLVVRTGATPLARVMARVGTGYAMHFNRRHDRVGHLVQNRYKSRLVTKDEDLLNLIRYVHLNPVRAGMVHSLAALGGYPWSGHAALMGAAQQPFHRCSEALAFFADDPETARERLVEFMQSGIRTAIAHAESKPMRDLVLEVCRSYDVDAEDLVLGYRDRRTSDARGVLAYRAATELRLSQSEIARMVGVSASAISRCLRRGRDRVRPRRRSR